MLNEQQTDLTITQQANSSVVLHLINTDAQDAENNIRIEHQGENCRTHIFGLAIASDRQTVSTLTQVVHTVGGGISEQTLKFVLADEANCSFRGELKIMKDAQQVAARQTNRNIVLSDKAKMRTMPQLEIYADDVKASHGASTGRLDETALFYMLQRGISPVAARRLLLQAFFSDTLQMLPQDEYNRIEQLINDRLNQLL